MDPGSAMEVDWSEVFSSGWVSVWAASSVNVGVASSGFALATGTGSSARAVERIKHPAHTADNKHNTFRRHSIRRVLSVAGS